MYTTVNPTKVVVGVTGVTGDPVTRSAQGREKDSAQQRNWKSVREQQRDTEFNCKRESALSRNAMLQSKATGAGGVLGVNALGHVARVIVEGPGSAMTLNLCMVESIAKEISSKFAPVS